ncbi:MAG: ABC transporter permease [Deltaproteobacteria bacterium]|nr:MAG: ABC transporter permease [Deltaproteobacteria bacterium]
MMPAGNLARMVVANTLRSRRHFMLSAFGIVIGIATFVVFLASTEQVGAVLEKIFPVEQVQVIAPHASLLGKDISKKLDDAIVDKIRSRPEVDRADPTSVVPRMALAFPAFGRGDFEGNDLRFEVGGFADGINPDFVNDDDRTRQLFKDWDSVKDDAKRVACEPPPREVEDEVLQSPPAPPKGKPPEPGRYYNPCPSPDRYYCDEIDRTCHHRVPVVMSPTMIEIYNGQFAKAHRLPIADLDFIRFVTQRGGLNAKAVLVGISNKAMPIGMTMPIPYIQRWNREFLGDEAATSYSSIIVRLRDRNRIAVFSQWLQDDLDLRLEDSLGEKFATALFVIRLVLVLISLVIIAISSINIAHNFFMQVTERRRELGLLRAVGATQRDVLMVVLGEAALIGLIGGVIGVVLGFGLAAGIDWGSAHYLPRFPYKPDSWFHFKWWIILGGLVCASGFSVLGGYLPARRAKAMEPAQALTQN